MRDTPEERLWDRIKVMPPITQAAIKAIIDFEEGIDHMGYDLSYYINDLPSVVAKAIEPWKAYNP